MIFIINLWMLLVQKKHSKVDDSCHQLIMDVSGMKQISSNDG
jgi:hypothetical protein